MTLVQSDHPFLMLHLCFIQCWIFLNFCKCALSSLISLSSKFWRRGEEKNWSLYVQKEEKFSLCQCVPAKRHFLLTFYCLFFLEKCVSKAPSAAKLSALPHYSELLMWRGKFLNAAFTNSREFSLVFSSCSFPFIWRVNVCVSWRT